MRFIFPFAIYGIKKLKIAGQLLVVCNHTSSISDGAQSELIPDLVGGYTASICARARVS